MELHQGTLDTIVKLLIVIQQTPALSSSFKKQDTNINRNIERT